MSRWNFSVEQEGMVVASGDAPTEDGAKREAGHYAMMYSQDGPVKVSVKEVQGTPTLPREGKAQGMIIPLTSQSCSTCGHDRSWHIEDGSCQFTSETGIKCRVHCCQYSENGKAQDEDFPDRFGELPERTRPSIFDGQPPLTEEDKRGYSKEQWAEIIAENSGGLDGVEAGGAAGEDRRTVEAVSKGDDGVESGSVGVGEQKGVDG